MQIGTGKDRRAALVQPKARYRRLSSLLLALGGGCLLAALVYGAYALFNTWLRERDRYLAAPALAAFPMAHIRWTASPSPTPWPSSTPTPTPTTPGTRPPRAGTKPTATSTPAATLPPTATLPPAATLPPTATPSPLPSPSPTASPVPAAERKPPSPPVKISIPALKVARTIVSLPRTRDRSTGTWGWDTKRLFRAGRTDLVGHWEGSAYPGQAGNMILVGHNYGYGYSGVFVRLGSLKAGQQVRIVDKAGRTHTYEVETVKRVKWRRQNFGELTQHLSLLSTGGPERLTLVSCSGADFEPFPERIYVVAKPVK